MLRSVMISNLWEALKQRPFHSIAVLTSDGETVVIDKPDSAAVLRKVGWLYLEPPDQTESRIISFRDIKEVRLGGLAVEDRGEGHSK